MIQFGTGGWRAEIGVDFTKANVQLLTCALAHKMKDEGVDAKGLVVGYDRRFLSKESAVWIAEAMAAQSIPCKIIHGEAPTPLIMFAVKTYGFAYGFAVTASHNPALYNGLKLFTAGGRDADEEVTADLEMYIADAMKGAVPAMAAEEGIEKGLISEINPSNDYIDTILDMVDVEAIRNAHLKVVLDPMYGVSNTSLKTILLTTRCEMEVIHERHDTLFGGRLPAPNEETLHTLRNNVLEHEMDIGIATDGDADRIGVIDDKGNFLHPNRILMILYYYLVKGKGWTGPVVRNLSTTHLLDKIAEDFNSICYEVPVGFKHISAKMRETNALIGGESSGGLTVRGHIEGKDGIYAAALLIEMIAKTGKKLSDICKEVDEIYGTTAIIEDNLTFRIEDKTRILNLVLRDKLIPDFGIAIAKVSYLDGCKIYFEDGGWISARFSGTEPLLRIYCEASTEKQAKDNCNAFRKFLDLA